MENQRISVRAVRGVAWLGSGQLIRQLLGFATNIVLARMLVPDDFGLFGMAFAIIEVAQSLTDFGLSAAIIQRRESNFQVLTTYFWLNLGVGIFTALALVGSGPLLANYLGRPELFMLMIPLAFNMVISSILVVPQAILSQNLKFREITFSQTLGSIIAAIGAVILASQGMGVWALTAQPVIGGIICGLSLYIHARWLPKGRPKISLIRDMLSFSGNMLGASIVSCAGRNIHAFILGRLLSGTSLGLYNLAAGITGIILYQVSSVIVRVMFPTMSKLSGNPDAQRTLWFKASSIIAVFSFPSMMGMIAVAPDLMFTVFGPSWVPAVEVLRILSALMAVQSVLTTSATVLMALGRADTLFHISLITTIVITFALWEGARLGGIEGAALGYAGVNIISLLLTTFLACQKIQASAWRFFVALIPWAFCAAIMGIGVFLLAERLFLVQAWIRLATCICAGIILYLLLLLIFARKATFEIMIDLRDRLIRG